MNLQDLKENMINSAKRRLSEHKSLGNKTPLSILEVAELLDLVNGIQHKASMSFKTQKNFSLN